MPTKTPKDEKKWQKAKDLAEEAGESENYAYIMGIYKKMRPDYEFKSGPEAKSAALASRWLQRVAMMTQWTVTLFSNEGETLFEKTFPARDHAEAEKKALALVKPLVRRFDNAEDWVVEPA